MQAQNKGMGKDIPCGGNHKKVGVAIISQTKQTPPKKKKKKVLKGTQRRSIYNDKEVHSSKRYDNHKYIHSNIGAPKYIKQIVTDQKGKRQ